MNKKVTQQKTKNNDNKRRIVYPGSFDPITFGHIDIIERLSAKFDEVIVLISSSTQKKYIFQIPERKKLVEKVFKSQTNVIVESWDGLLVDFMKKNKILYLAKGLRNARDFEYEITMDHTNKTLFPEIETFYLISRPEYSFISSTLVKEIAFLKGDLTKFVPEVVKKELESKL